LVTPLIAWPLTVSTSIACATLMIALLELDPRTSIAEGAAVIEQNTPSRKLL
jgi:hypothetical protein